MSRECDGMTYTYANECVNSHLLGVGGVDPSPNWLIRRVMALRRTSADIESMDRWIDADKMVYIREINGVELLVPTVQSSEYLLIWFENSES